MRSLRTIFNEGNPNKVPVAAQSSRLGTLLSLAPRFVKGAVASNVLALPENARAAAILSTFVSAGTATGSKTPIPGPAPAAGEVGITDDGNIVFQATDAVTEAEVVYISVEGDVIEETLTVSSDVADFGANREGVLLLEAEALTGGSTGVFAVEARGTTPGAGEAAITADGTQVEFAAADAVTSCRVKYVATPGVGVAPDAAVPALDAEDKNF